MTTFDKRKDAFENKFAHDEELRFKAESRRNKLLGLWAAGLLGKTGADADAYAKDVIAADFEQVRLVDLGGQSDPQLLPQVIAAAMGVRQSATQPPVRAVVEEVGDRSWLVVLDNCEHLLDACAAFVTELLRECPRARVLATSRQALGLTGEVVSAVPSLSVPEAVGSTAPASAPGDLLDFDAVRLFVDRAAAVVPSFRLSEHNAPVVAGIGLAATFGAGVTAQLGAMRINEEIDALESMGIPPVEYLVSTRIVAGMVAITPLYSIAVILSFVASQFTTVVLFGQSGGLYEHYFNTFLNPIDLLWSFLQAVLMAITILLIHTYYGYFASGGPAGVGNATGNAVRTSLIVVVSVTLLVSLSIYGTNGNFNLSG